MWMVDVALWLACAVCAIGIFLFLSGLVAIMFSAGASREKHDPALNAFQQPLRRDYWPVRNFDR